MSGHAFFIEVADVLGFDDWVCDESLRTDTERKARRGEIAGRLSELFATRTAAE